MIHRCRSLVLCLTCSQAVGFHILGSPILGSSFIRFIKSFLIISFGYSNSDFILPLKTETSVMPVFRGEKKIFQLHRGNQTLLLPRCGEAACDCCLKAVLQLSCSQGMREKKAFLHPTRHTAYALQHMPYCLCYAV